MPATIMVMNNQVNNQVQVLDSESSEFGTKEEEIDRGRSIDLTKIISYFDTRYLLTSAPILLSKITLPMSPNFTEHILYQVWKQPQSIHMPGPETEGWKRAIHAGTQERWKDTTTVQLGYITPF